MNPDIKAKWVAALDSGIYKQTTGYLHTSDGFCCLGVLCHLYKQEKGGEWKDSDRCFMFSVNGAETTLPDAVVAWAGLVKSDPDVRIGDCDNHNPNQTLAGLNDEGASFKHIAQVIREQL